MSQLNNATGRYSTFHRIDEKIAKQWKHIAEINGRKLETMVEKVREMEEEKETATEIVRRTMDYAMRNGSLGVHELDNIIEQVKEGGR